MSESISTTQKEQLEHMLGMLAHIRLRPGMYMGSTDAVALRAFVSGFFVAANSLGTHISRVDYAIWKERGWETDRPVDAIHQMQDKGWTEDEIILETFTMMILGNKRLYNLTGTKVIETHNLIRQNISNSGREISPELAQQMENLEKELGISRDNG
ncbi:MAG: hypothetical protein K8I30_00985 [Anaerolineae bacterium]|nr:hypothetical protein [Anaerolineae bacterium]